MKKGLLSILASALLVVGCQNYDDQFNNLESQISALATTVAGLSQVQSDLSTLAGTVNSLSSTVNSLGDTIDTAVADGLTDIQADIDAIEAAVADVASSEEVSDLSDAVAASQEDLDELLANSSVFNGSVTINSVATLNAFHNMGSTLAIINGSATFTVSTEMDMVKVQEVADQMLTITGDLTYTSAASTIDEVVFNNLSGVATLTLEQAGGYHFPVLASAAKINLSDKYESTITRVNFPALASVLSMGTDSSNNNLIEFTKATEMSFAALPRYAPNALELITKKGKADDVVTLDISALRDVDAAGEVAGLALKISGPNAVSITSLDGESGSVELTNVLAATINDYDGSIVINAGVESLTANNVVELSGAMTDIVTVDITGVIDPNDLTGSSPDESGPAIDLDGLADLTSATLAGNFESVDVTSNGNIETLVITANVNDGAINIDDNSDLENITLTGAKATGVTVNANNSLVNLTVDATYVAGLGSSDTLDGSIAVTSNTDLETLVLKGTNVSVLTVTGNVDLETITATELTTLGATAASNNVTISGNKFSASVAQDKTNATSCTDCDDLEANDLGSFTTTSGMDTLKTYLALVAANTSAVASVYFDTVESTTNATGVETTGETTGQNDTTVILKKVAAEDAVYTGQNSAVAETRAFLMDIDELGGINITVDGVELLHNGTDYGTVTMTGNSAIDLVAIKSSLATTRATTLGVTLDAYAKGNSSAPGITFRSNVSSATGSNGENYTNAQVAAIGTGTTSSFLTSYDNVTVTVGDLSVTASIGTQAALASASGATAAGLIAEYIKNAWNTKYGSTGTSSNLSVWGAMSTPSSGTITIAAKASTRGSRGFGDTIAVAWSKATAAQASIATAGVVTTTAALVLDWTIGATESTSDNTATAEDIIITLAEGTNKVTSGSQATVTFASAGASGELSNSARQHSNSGAGTATTTAQNIYPLEARLDVVPAEDANEGVVSTAAVTAVNKTRVHWFGS